MFFIFLVNTGLLIGTALLMKHAKTDGSSKWLWLTLFGGIATFLFRPLVLVSLGLQEDSIGGIWQLQLAWDLSALCWVVFGFYFIIWSVREFVQRKKVKGKNPTL